MTPKSLATSRQRQYKSLICREVLELYHSINQIRVWFIAGADKFSVLFWIGWSVFILISRMVFVDLFHHTRFLQRNNTLITSVQVPGKEEGKMVVVVVLVQTIKFYKEPITMVLMVIWRCYFYV